MAASSINLTGVDAFEAGATYRRLFTFVDENGDPIDLTLYDPQSTALAAGGSARFRASVDASGDPVLELDSVTTRDHEGIYILQPATMGQVELVVDPDTLTALSYNTSTDAAESIRSGVWDLEARGVAKTLPAVDDCVRLAAGTWSISPEVTRPQP
jgi:hypothetical protein